MQAVGGSGSVWVCVVDLFAKKIYQFFLKFGFPDTSSSIVGNYQARPWNINPEIAALNTSPQQIKLMKIAGTNGIHLDTS